MPIRISIRNYIFPILKRTLDRNTDLDFDSESNMIDIPIRILIHNWKLSMPNRHFVSGSDSESES